MPGRPSSPFYGANLKLPIAVRPGQPINISWTVAAPSKLGNVVATISYQNVVLYTSKSIKAGLSSDLAYVAGELNISIPVAQSNLAVQLGLYQITPVATFATIAIDLSVVADGSDNGPFTALAYLTVEPEPVDVSWWTWSPSYPVGVQWGGITEAAGSAPWNTAYTIAGQFFNKSKWSVMTAQLTLNETNDVNQITNRGSLPVSANIGPNPNDVEFNSITQNWSWVVCPSGFLTGPNNGPLDNQFLKFFNYTVVFSVKDNWGNNYLPVTSNPLTWGVQVAADKATNQKNAQASFILGVGYSASVVLAWLGAPLIAVATGLCQQAQDPPTPDFDYQKTAKKPICPLPESFEKETQLPATRAFLKSILESIAIWSALGQTEGKLMAARVDKNAKGVKLQTSTYRDFVKELMKTTDALRSNFEKVRMEVQAEASLSIDNVRDAVRTFQLYGIPGPFEKLIKNACHCSSGNPVEQFLKSVDPITIPAIADSLTVLAHGVLSNANYTHESMHSVLVVPNGSSRNRVKPRVSK